MLIFCHLAAARMRTSIDELQATLFGEESRQCFGSAAFLDKAAFDQVGGAGELPESPGKLEVCEESFEVLRETLAQTGELLAELLQKLSHRTLAGLKIRGVTNHHQIRLDLMPARIGHLGCKVAHPMHPAASAQTLRPHLVDGLDKPTGSVGRDEQGLCMFEVCGFMSSSQTGLRRGRCTPGSINTPAASSERPHNTINVLAAR